MSRAWSLALVGILTIVACGGIPTANADVVVEAAPSGVTLNVGAGQPSQASATRQMQIRNTGPDPVTITNVDASDPIPGYVTANYAGGVYPVLNAGDTWSFSVTVTANTNGGTADTSTPSTVTVYYDAQTITLSIPVSVTDWRAARLEIPSPQQATHVMPCPAGFDSSTTDFNVRVTNTGDYPLSVTNLYVSDIRSNALYVQPLGTGTFSVPANGAVDRAFRVHVQNYAQEGTVTGRIVGSGGGSTDSADLNIAIQHPVELVLPSQTARHDFGQVELMRPPENPWSHLVEERCGYKEGVVTLDTPLPPGFVVVDPNPLHVPEGGSALLRVIPTFNSTHANLLLTPQDFTVKFRTNGALNPSYDFRATPSFISVQEMKTRLQQLATGSTSEEGKEVARRTLELVVNRTEVRRPTTPGDLEDAGRIVGLAEPVILAVEHFETMETLNAQGRQEQSVESLSVLAAGLDSLRSVCNGVLFAADRTECLAIITLLETTMAGFAQDARRHFEGLAGGGLTELGELRAAESLALVLEALGDEEGAAAFDARAQQRFVNFTSRLDAADAHLENIERRESLLTPGGFVSTDVGYFAWHPFGMLFLGSFESYADAEFDAARAELRLAGDENRLRDLEAESTSVHADLSTGRVLSLAITIVYGLVVLVVALQFSGAWLRRRGDARLIARGDVVLGKTPPLV